MEELVIRPVCDADAQRLAEIYSYYVEQTAVSFEYTAPSEEEFRKRISFFSEKYPYLAAVRDGQIVGYAYAGPFHPREAYSRCCEMTVYLDRDARGQGIGRALYEALEAQLREMGILNLYALIAVPGHGDAYLTPASERFHAALGYQTAARFHHCGYKFGQWYDVVWMEKLIGEHGAAPQELRRADGSPWEETAEKS